MHVANVLTKPEHKKWSPPWSDVAVGSSLMVALLALSTALLWGCWRFGINLYSRRMPSRTVVLVSNAAATTIYIAFGLLRGDLVYDLRDVLPGLMGGLLNLGGTLLVLRAVTSGKMGTVSGISTLYVLIPVMFSFFLGEALALSSLIGIAIMLTGLVVFAVSRAEPSTGTGTKRSVILMALGAALLWGLAVIVLDVGSRENLYGTLSMAQGVQIVVLLIIAALTRTPMELQPRAVTPLVASGAALALGSIAFYTAADEGDIGVVSVLAGLSPIVTALLAWALLKERMRKPEVAALVVVLIGTGMVVA
jgi:uncharacterized membrane protein